MGVAPCFDAHGHARTAHATDTSQLAPQSFEGSLSFLPLNLVLVNHIDSQETGSRRCRSMTGMTSAYG